MQQAIVQDISCHFSQNHVMVTKILDFSHKHSNQKFVKSFFLISCQVFQKFSQDWQQVTNFSDQKSRTQLFFFKFFKTKVSDFVSNINDDCFQLSFQVYNVSVAQKLKSLGFLIELFFAWLKIIRYHNYWTNIFNIGHSVLVRHPCKITPHLTISGNTALLIRVKKLKSVFYVQNCIFLNCSE